jgi:hypothetical protein
MARAAERHLTAPNGGRIVHNRPVLGKKSIIKCGESRMQLRISTGLMLLLCGMTCRATAQEYCVTCTAPSATYRCSIASEAGTAAPPARGQLLCITELAKTGNHASCSVGRTQAEPCAGEPRTVLFTSVAEEALPPIGTPPPGHHEPGRPATADGMPEPAEPAPPSEAPPQTVEELAKQTVEASGKGLEKAGEAVSDGAKSTGEAVGDAVSKTWKCMTSLFSDC